MGKWVVSGNEGLTEEGVLVVFVFMFVCLVHSTVKARCLIIQVTVILETEF